MSVPREFVLDEKLLDEAIALTDVDGEMAHKAIHHLLRQLLTMGLAHRDHWFVRLFNGDSDAEIDPDYAEHLDRRNCGLVSEWGRPHDEER